MIDNNNESILVGNNNKFSYLDDLKFLSKIKKEKSVDYLPKILYNQQEKVFFFFAVDQFLSDYL